jgi:hypothetical protein
MAYLRLCKVLRCGGKQGRKFLNLMGYILVGRDWHWKIKYPLINEVL